MGNVVSSTSDLSTPFIHSLIHSPRFSPFRSREQKLYSGCGAAFAASQAAIQRWLQLSTLNAVPYVSEATKVNGSMTALQCSASDRARAQALLGDSSRSKSQVMASSAQYSKEATGTIRRMAQYSVELNTYNAAYLA